MLYSFSADLGTGYTWDRYSQSVGECELWHDTYEDCQCQVPQEHTQVVVGVVCACQEQCDGHREQELPSGREQRLVVQLLPHGQVIVRAAVELKRRAFHEVKHHVEPDDVRGVGQCPRPLGVDSR